MLVLAEAVVELPQRREQPKDPLALHKVGHVQVILCSAREAGGVNGRWWGGAKFADLASVLAGMRRPPTDSPPHPQPESILVAVARLFRCIQRCSDATNAHLDVAELDMQEDVAVDIKVLQLGQACRGEPLVCRPQLDLWEAFRYQPRKSRCDICSQSSDGVA